MLTLNVEGQDRTAELAAPEAADRIRALLAERDSLRVQLDPIEDSADTEGHLLDSRALVTLRILDEEDDTEGHAISIHFPSPTDAREFRNRLLVTGAIVGSVTLAGLGVSAGLSQAPGAAVPAGNQAEVSDSWARMGVPGTAGAANAAANELTDSWQAAEVAGSGAAAAAAADKLTDSWQRSDTPGAAGAAGAAGANQQSDSWQRAEVAGTGAASNAEADKLTDSWQRSDTPGAAGAAGSGSADESEDEGNK